VSKQANNPELDLINEVAACSGDPLRYVLFAFPWGSGELKDRRPEDWQIEILNRIRDGLPAGRAIQEAIASGHGIGKSCLVSWIILWAISTFENTKGVVTANTENQLKTKTWAELAKWHRLCINKHWFELTATALYAKDPAHEKTWRIDMVPWSERNTEAFAGLHNQGRRILIVMDEASAIPDVIWEVSEGALTDEDTQIIWCAFGNPTRNTGRFRECFGRFKHRWSHHQIDSRSVTLTNKDQIKQWVDDYGEDSDFVRVRVRGVFPRAGSMQFIPGDIVDAAAVRPIPPANEFDPLIIGVDVARFGDDQSTIYFRRGRDARTIKPIKLRNVDTMTLAAKVAECHRLYKPDAIFVDGTGVGGGVVDRLNQLNIPVTEVQFGAKADRSLPGQDEVAYANKRAEMWGSLKAWLKGGCIPNDQELIADLTGVEYGFVLRDGRDAIILEKKSDMKKRGLASPDDGDGLAITFAYAVEVDADNYDDYDEMSDGGRSSIGGY
jgi:hypothetical protein